MASTHATAHIPFRIFTLPDAKPGGSGVAIGRNHASWFLVLARPEGIRKARVIHCLNTIIPDDPSSVGALSSAGRHCFAVGGQVGPKILKELASMRDCEGRAAFEILENYPDDHPLGLCALVEVQVPDEELMYACARCGRWETQRGPRFLRCSGCKSRFYCSAQVSSLTPSLPPHLVTLPRHTNALALFNARADTRILGILLLHMIYTCDPSF